MPSLLPRAHTLAAIAAKIPPDAAAVANRRYRLRHGGIWLRFEVIERIDAFLRRLRHDASRTQAAWYLIDQGLKRVGETHTRVRVLPKRYQVGRGRPKRAT